jgi:hypothetical protein
MATPPASNVSPTTKNQSPELKPASHFTDRRRNIGLVIDRTGHEAKLRFDSMDQVQKLDPMRSSGRVDCADDQPADPAGLGQRPGQYSSRVGPMHRRRVMPTPIPVNTKGALEQKSPVLWNCPRVRQWHSRQSEYQQNPEDMDGYKKQIIDNCGTAPTLTMRWVGLMVTRASRRGPTGTRYRRCARQARRDQPDVSVNKPVKSAARR